MSEEQYKEKPLIQEEEDLEHPMNKLYKLKAGVSKLSDVLIGAEEHFKQAIDALICYGGDGKLRVCAMGVLGWEVGGRPDKESYPSITMKLNGRPTTVESDIMNEYIQDYKPTDDTNLECPDCSGENHMNLNNLIAHYNDIHEYSFTQIGEMLRDRFDL